MLHVNKWKSKKADQAPYGRGHALPYPPPLWIWFLDTPPSRNPWSAPDIYMYVKKKNSMRHPYRCNRYLLLCSTTEIIHLTRFMLWFPVLRRMAKINPLMLSVCSNVDAPVHHCSRANEIGAFALVSSMIMKKHCDVSLHALSHNWHWSQWTHQFHLILHNPSNRPHNVCTDLYILNNMQHCFSLSVLLLHHSLGFYLCFSCRLQNWLAISLIKEYMRYRLIWKRLHSWNGKVLAKWKGLLTQVCF